MRRRHMMAGVAAFAAAALVAALGVAPAPALALTPPHGCQRRGTPERHRWR